MLPSYYSAGAALFAPGGEIEGVSSWDDLQGRTVAILQGNYVIDAAPQTPALQNVTLLQVASAQGELARQLHVGCTAAHHGTACRHAEQVWWGGQESACALDALMTDVLLCRLPMQRLLKWF